MMLKVIIAVIVIMALTVISVWNYRRFMPKPKSCTDKTYKVKVVEKSIDADGRHIYGELLIPEGVTGKLPTVIISHGYGSSYKLSKNAIGKFLVMSGYAAYVFDFCGGSKKSKSSGSWMDMTILKEKEDLLTVIDYVKTLEVVNPERLYLLGESQGGMVSAITAVERQDDIKAMVLYYPAFCIQEDAHRKYESKEELPETVEAFQQKIGRSYYADVWDFDVFSYMPAFEKPVLIMHGDKDTMVPHSYGERGAKAYKNAEIITFPGEIHGFYGKGKVKAAKLSYAFFEKNH